MDGSFLLILVFIVVAILIRLAAGVFDRSRITQYVEERGGQILDSNWSPFGPGWFGEKSDRIYGVRYLDKEGNLHEAHCKTSLWSGVYLTEDRIVKHADRPTPPARDLEAENRRLRKELERIRSQAKSSEPGAAADGGT